MKRLVRALVQTHADRRDRSIAILAAGTLSLVLLALPRPAAAFNVFLCDDGNRFTATTNFSKAAKWKNQTSEELTINSVSFPSNSPYISWIRTALLRWNRAPQNFTFTSSSTSPRGVSMGDGNSDIVFANGVCGGGAVACSPIVYSCNAGITESDIVFVPTAPYTLSENKIDIISYGGASENFAGVLVHELGHALGLAHTANVYSVMGSGQRHTHTNGSTFRIVPGEDASAGAAALYGARSFAGADLGVSHWRRTNQTAAPSAGAISLHGFVRVLDASSSAPVPVFGIEPRRIELQYQVRAGQNVQVEFTLENNGISPQNGVELRYYLSTDDNITTADQPLTPVLTTNLVRDVATLRTETLTIPGTVTPGRTLFIGLIVDPNNRIAEFDENNATYIGILIQ